MGCGSVPTAMLAAATTFRQRAILLARGFTSTGLDVNGASLLAGVGRLWTGPGKVTGVAPSRT
jgi:hypothetical protein